MNRGARRPTHLDGGEGEELQRADGEDEGLDDVPVAPEDVGDGDVDLLLELVPVDGLGAHQLHQGHGERGQSVDQEDEDDVVGVEPEVMHAGGVPEPNRLRRSQVSPECRLRLADACERQHGGGGQSNGEGDKEGEVEW